MLALTWPQRPVVLYVIQSFIGSSLWHNIEDMALSNMSCFGLYCPDECQKVINYLNVILVQSDPHLNPGELCRQKKYIVRSNTGRIHINCMGKERTKQPSDSDREIPSAQERWEKTNSGIYSVQQYRFLDGNTDENMQAALHCNFNYKRENRHAVHPKYGNA